MNPLKFWSRVDIKEKHECWEWQSTTQGHGDRAYGYFRNGSRAKGSLKKTYAHRHAYKLSAPAESIEGLDIRHRCDNPRCCNPHHLLSGTRSQNVMDAVYRGRVRPPKRY